MEFAVYFINLLIKLFLEKFYFLTLFIYRCFQTKNIEIIHLIQKVFQQAIKLVLINDIFIDLLLFVNIFTNNGPFHFLSLCH